MTDHVFTTVSLGLPERIIILSQKQQGMLINLDYTLERTLFNIRGSKQNLFILPRHNEGLEAGPRRAS